MLDPQLRNENNDAIVLGSIKQGTSKSCCWKQYYADMENLHFLSTARVWKQFRTW